MDIITNITNQPYRAAVLALLSAIVALLVYIVWFITG
jgi:hypothetical protein